MDTIKLLASITVLLSLFLLIYQIWSVKAAKASREPPEPAGAWPIIGHLGLLMGTEPLHRTLAALSELWGPTFTFRIGQKRALVVSSMDLARECFVTNDRAFASRPSWQSAMILGFDRAMFGLAPYGPYWCKVHKIVAVELQSRRRLKITRNIWVEEVDSMVRALYGLSLEDEKAVDLRQWLYRLSLTIMLRMVIKKEYLINPGEDEPARELQELVEQITSQLGVFTVSDAFPWLERLDVGCHVKAFKRIQQKMDRFATSWLAMHRHQKESCNTDVGDGDFIDALIGRLDGGHLSDLHDDDTIIKLIVTAGTGTTSDTMQRAFSFILNNRHVLRKAQDELDLHVGTRRHVDESDIEKLPFLQSIVKETARLHPVAPVLLPHQSIEPVKVGGYDIPAGTVLFVNAWKIHRDPAIWSDPEEFMPERFSSSRKNTSFGGHGFPLIPFGLGLRACPGSSIGLQVAHSTLARLLHGFDWSTLEDRPVDMTESRAASLEVLLRPRLPSNLYQ